MEMQESTIAKRTGSHGWMSNGAASAPIPPEAAFESDSDSEYEAEFDFEC